MDKNNNLYVTKEGLGHLKSELENLLEVKRPAIAKRIKEAREMGDISENSEYDAARQEQSFIEGRIEELEEITGNKPFQFRDVEDRLNQSFSKIMNKGFKAFKAYIQ